MREKKSTATTSPAHIWSCINDDVNRWCTATAREWKARRSRERDSVAQFPPVLDEAHDFHYHYVRERLDLEIKTASEYTSALYEECRRAADAHQIPKDRDFHLATLENCIMPCIVMSSERFDEEMRLNTYRYFTSGGGNDIDAAVSTKHNEREFHKAFDELKNEWRARIEIDASKADPDVATASLPSSGSKRSSSREQTKTMYAAWQTRYKALKAANKAMTDTAIAKKIAGERISKEKSESTIRHNMIP